MGSEIPRGFRSKLPGVLYFVDPQTPKMNSTCVELCYRFFISFFEPVVPVHGGRRFHGVPGIAIKTWAWTSSPITISQSPVAPLIRADGLTGLFMVWLPNKVSGGSLGFAQRLAP